MASVLNELTKWFWVWRIYDFFNGHKLNYHGGWVQGYRADV